MQCYAMNQTKFTTVMGFLITLDCSNCSRNFLHLKFVCAFVVYYLCMKCINIYREVVYYLWMKCITIYKEVVYYLWMTCLAIYKEVMYYLWMKCISIYTKK